MLQLLWRLKATSNTMFYLKSEAHSQSSMGFPERTKMVKRKQQEYFRWAFQKVWFVLFFTASHLFTNDDGIPPRLYSSSMKKRIRCQQANLIIHEREKKQQKKCGNGMLSMLTLLCIFIYSARIYRKSIHVNYRNKCMVPQLVYIASLSTESWSVVSPAPFDLVSLLGHSSMTSSLSP